LSLVSFVRANDSSIDALKKAIKRSLNLIRFSFARSINKIVIKPNMCYYYPPSTGEVTSPQFVSAVIDIFRENLSINPDFFIVESDASAMKCKYVFKMLGYHRIAKEKNVKLINLSEEKNKIVDIKVNGWYLRFYIPEIFHESDFLINVPKIKYMADVKITCALKNMYGCNAYPRKSIYHVALNEAIVGINKIIKPDLVIVDGLIVYGKNTRRLNLVMASKDPVALDAAASNVMGIDPTSVHQLVLASKENIGNLEFIPVGEAFSYVKQSFPAKSVKDKIRETLASTYLRIFHE